MEERLKQLEKEQAELLAKASKDDFANWLSHPLTKAAMLQCRIDAEQIKDMWSAGELPTAEVGYFRGQAAYADRQPQTMRELKADDQS